MILSVTLTCYEYISLLTRYQPSQRATESCDYVFTGSKDALCIQPSALEMYVNANICAPCPSFRIVTQIDISDTRNYNRFSVSLPCNSNVILHRHAKPLLLQPPMTYSQAPDHSDNVGLTKTMLLIWTPLVVTRWSDLIHICRYWRCHSWSCCGTHRFPLFSKWRRWFKKYHTNGMTRAA